MKSKRIIMCAFLLIVAFFTAANFHLALQPSKDFVRGRRDFVSFRDEIQSVLKSDDFSYKNSFINLNGLFSKLTGKRLINETVVLNNGMLGQEMSSIKDTQEIAGRIAEFDSALGDAGIPFLYVQAPYKMDREGTLMPTGLENRAHENTDKLAAQLDEAGVTVMNLMPEFSATAEQIGEYFFKTDHHWNYPAAFRAYQRVTGRLQELLGDKTDISQYLDRANWTEHVIEEIHLGSQGRRVGQYVVGVDDVVYLTPDFETEISDMVPSQRALYRGSFEEALLRMNRAQKDGDYFNKDVYSMYTGVNVALNQIRNDKAPVQKRILLIKESFALPMMAFMSTVFKEIDALDPRHFTECSLMEYALRMRPDAVVMMLNPSALSLGKTMNFGADMVWANLSAGTPVLAAAHERIEMPAAKSNFEYRVIFDAFAPDQAYTLSVGDVQALQGAPDGLTAALLDGDDKLFASCVFDLEYARENSGFVWKFRTPENTDGMKLILYSGEYKKTKGVSMAFSDVRLYEGYLTE